MLDWQGKGTILVVDDEPQVRTITELLLSSFGFTILTAEDGAAGLKVFTEKVDTIDLVIMDLTMPKMSGVQACRAMRACKPGIRVILTSGYNENSSVDELRSDGLTDFLQKPFELESLIAVTRKALGR